jgi:hypothetical protein
VTADIVTTIGLALDIVGVFLLWKFELGKGVPFTDSNDVTHLVKLGRDSDRTPIKMFFARLGLPLIILGFVLQIAGVWIN